MDPARPTALSVCSGVGMLDLGVDIALGGTRSVGYVERDSFAASILLERMEDEALEPAPVFAGDLAGFPFRSFRGLVDIVVAGIPCQPHSTAGKRAGTADERWLWPDLLAGIRVLGPSLIVLENVAGFRSSGGLDAVLGDLASLGCRVAWTSLRASEVGAAHERDRVFVVAVADPGRRDEQRRGGADDIRGQAPASCGGRHQRQRDGHSAGNGGEAVADHNGRRLGEHGHSQQLHEGLWSAFGDDPNGCGARVGDANGRRQPRQRGSGEGGAAEPGDELGDATCQRRQWDSSCGREAVGRFEHDDDPVGDASSARPQGLAEGTHAPGREVSSGPTGPAGRELFAPGPSDPRWPSIIVERPDLAPAVEPGLRVLVDGVAYVVDESRADRLRAIGNGVVALQAAVAVRQLVRLLGW